MAKKENPTWWKDRVGLLKMTAERVSHIEPSVVYEKDGAWPLIKLVLIDNAFGVYFPNIRKHVGPGQWWPQVHFIDLNAGNGLTRVMGKLSGAHLVAGTSILGAHRDRVFRERFGQAFDFYHFVEPHKPWAKVLEARLRAILPEDRFRVYDMPGAAAVAEIAKQMKATVGGKPPHFMALVDPEGLKEISLPALDPLFSLGRGDFIFNFQYQGVKRAPEWASTFFGDDAWPKDGDEDAIRAFFWSKLAKYGRPRTESFTVAAGEGSGRYAYEIAYSAAQTNSNNTWLTNLKADLDGRMAGIDGTMLDRLLAAKKNLFDFPSSPDK